MKTRRPFAGVSLRARIRVAGLLVGIAWAGASIASPAEPLVNGSDPSILIAYPEPQSTLQTAGLLDYLLDLIEELLGIDEDESRTPPENEPIPGSGDGW